MLIRVAFNRPTTRCARIARKPTVSTQRVNRDGKGGFRCLEQMYSSVTVEPIEIGANGYCYISRFLQRDELIDVWSDDRLSVGADWRAEIESALTRAKIAVLVVSPNFLASRFIWNDEMPLILAHARAGMDVLPLSPDPAHGG